MSDFLKKLWKEIKQAYIEITAITALIDALVNAQAMVELSNRQYNGEIGIEWFLILFTVQFIIIPAILSIIPGIVIHWIRKKFKG